MRVYDNSALLLAALLILMGCSKASSSRENSDDASASKNLLRCVSPNWDLGEVDGGARYSHAFALKNTGDGTARIEDVVSSCGCIVASNSVEAVDPGEVVELPVSILLPTLPGRFYRNVTITSSIGDVRETLQLAIRGRCRVTPGLFSMPKSLDFGEADGGGEELAREFVVGRYDGSAVEFLRVEPNRLGVEIAEEPRNADSVRGIVLRVRMSVLKLAVGSHSDTLVLRTSAPEPYQSLQIPVSVRRKAAPPGDLVSSLFLPACKVGVPVDCYISSNAMAGAIESLHSVRFEGNAAVEARVRDGAAVGSVELRVVPSGESEPRLVRGMLTASYVASDGSMKEQQIPVTMVFD